jgi:hypothetical protein
LAVIEHLVRGAGFFGLLLTAVAGCRSREGTATRGDASPIATPSRRDAGAATGRAGGGPSPIDALGTIYPPGAPPHPLAIRLCEALHAVAARRKAQCCGGDPAPFLATECARVLGATLHAGTVELEEAAIDRCASATDDALAGCDWVTPGPPAVPEACQRLLRGKLERGAVCRSSLECAGDRHCEGVSPTRTGVCAAPAGEGAGCGTHVDVLATYLADRHLATTHPFCADHCSLVAHQCGPLPLVGSACLAHVNCAPSQRCFAGRCSAAPRGARGEPCGAAPCADGLRCIDAVCAPLAQSGEACTSDLDCAVGACVRGEDGRRHCGPQCSPSLDALRGRDGGPTLGLPVKARAGAHRR